METTSIGRIAAPHVIAEIHIQLVQQENSMGLSVQSSADPLTSLGLLELAKDSLKQQNREPKSSLVIARPGIG